MGFRSEPSPEAGECVYCQTLDLTTGYLESPGSPYSRQTKLEGRRARAKSASRWDSLPKRAMTLLEDMPV